MVQLQPSQSRQKSLPTMYDLPSEDPEEPGLVDEFHFGAADNAEVTIQQLRDRLLKLGVDPNSLP
ncbi:MAG: hypothetical protein F6K47_04730 [Symploca sp. SIO2E6]|nr:hypothetical protein [Symploca sp. SIO2E6]